MIENRVEKETNGITDLMRVLTECMQENMVLFAGHDPENWLKETYDYLRASFFPENFPDRTEEKDKKAILFYLDVLNHALKEEMETTPFDPCRSLALLTEEERKYCRIRDEYDRFLACLWEGHLYAFYRLSEVCTPYRTFGHIAGVHHIAMETARRLVGKGVRMDPGLLSAAAILHDVGKFGCRPNESRRVPYLHYYYAYQFCERMGLPAIGALASNHSVWDLELEDLSCENLLLIYADFRVKSIRDEAGREQIHFWSLDQSYQVILDKLDNVDVKKQLRYEKVFAKLKDFENYIHSLESEKEIYPALADADTIVSCFKNAAIRSNLALLHDIGKGKTYLSLMERILSERNPRHLRALLTTLEEYQLYLPQDLKRTILDFLYDMLSNKEGNVRRTAARVCGRLIGGYEIHYTKQIPEGYTAPRIGDSTREIWTYLLGRILNPPFYVHEQQQRWIGYGLKNILSTALVYADKAEGEEILGIYIRTLLDTTPGSLTRFFMLDGAAEIPMSSLTEEQIGRIEACIEAELEAGRQENLAACFNLIRSWKKQGWTVKPEYSLAAGRILESGQNFYFAVRYSLEALHEGLRLEEKEDITQTDFARIYLENQRTDIPWICRNANLRILYLKQEAEGENLRLFQYAAHLLNLLQYGDRVVIRLQAGENLVKAIPRLNAQQTKELLAELFRALEIGDQNTAAYVPRFLGRIYSLLGDEERKEFRNRVTDIACGRNPAAVRRCMETVGVILAGWKDKAPRREELTNVEAILMRGLAHYDGEVCAEAFYVLGHDIFGSPAVDHGLMRTYFVDFARKILTLITDTRDDLYLYYKAASLNYIYKGLSVCLMEGKNIDLPEDHLPAAFFPGTFDPFTLGHRSIVQKLAEQGYSVYLPVDEFSWSKKTQPFKIRQKIVALSTADIRHAYVFPEEIPINIANPRDMRHLRELFPGREVVIVAGLDVLEDASAYRAYPVEDSVHGFRHIVFSRNREITEENKKMASNLIQAPVQYLSMEKRYERISSTMIRRNVTAGKDISAYVDRMAEDYIYANGTYSMEPRYKKTASMRAIDTEEEMLSDGRQALYLRDQDADGRLCGAVFYHTIDSRSLYQECGNSDLAEDLRRQVSGSLAVLTAAFGEQAESINELLARLTSRGYSYALCFKGEELKKELLLHGALAGPGDCYMINLRHPLVLFSDVEAAIRENMMRKASVQAAVSTCHEDLLKALIRLYPGQLVLSFDSRIMNYKLIRMITSENHVSSKPVQPRQLGPDICVPFGKILKGVLVPNTVTQELDLEKRYDADLEKFHIVPFPGYAPLEVQIRTIRSMNRPLILVDDLYHKGYRMDEIRRYLKSEGIENWKLRVGVISGHGHDLARMGGEDVEAIYDIPDMRAWLIESDLYPFLGGDGVESGSARGIGLPSINPILPYEIPAYLQDASVEAFYKISETCLENAGKIFRTLEKEYSQEAGRRLTLERLPEVTAEARIPESCTGRADSMRMTASAMLKMEEQKLRRYRHIYDRSFH